MGADSMLSSRAAVDTHHDLDRHRPSIRDAFVLVLSAGILSRMRHGGFDKRCHRHIQGGEMVEMSLR